MNQNMNQKRYVLLPIKHDNLWQIFKKQQQVLWTTEEIDFARDAQDFDSLNEHEQHFILTIIAFFAGSDMLIMDNIMEQFMAEIEIAEAKAFYAIQSYIELIHSETYSLMLQKFAPKHKYNELFNAIENNPTIKQKAQFATKYMDPNLPLAERLWAFCIFEGVLFSASFASIYWLRTKGKCPGLTFSNTLIARDEALHTEFGVEMYKMIQTPLTTERIHAIIKEAVTCEINFVVNSLPKKIIGMNATQMIQYVQFCADRLLQMIQQPTIWNVQQPFTFMEMISIDSKTNFFEKRVDAYQLANVGQSKESFSTNENF